MQHKNLTRAFLSALLFVLLIGCSAKDNPICSNGYERSATVFQEPLTLFADLSYEYNEVDLSTLNHGPDSGAIAAPGLPVAIDYQGVERHWCLAVTSEDNRRILYKWLGDARSSDDPPPVWGGVLFEPIVPT